MGENRYQQLSMEYHELKLIRRAVSEYIFHPDRSGLRDDYLKDISWIRNLWNQMVDFHKNITIGYREAKLLREALAHHLFETDQFRLKAMYLSDEKWIRQLWNRINETEQALQSKSPL
jgi:hypothetical protein